MGTVFGDISHPHKIDIPLCGCYAMRATRLNLKGKTMTYKITSDCISCGACEAECPENAISEGDGQYVINPDLCQDCGSCAEVCPTGACIPA